MILPTPTVRGDHGIALLVTLWTLSLLALLTLSFAQDAWVERHRVRNMIDAAKATAHLQAGLAFGIAVLLHANREQGWSRDGTIYHLEFEQSDLAIALQDANGCLNINTIDPVALAHLLQAIGLEKERAQSLAAAVIDWRDPDQLLTPDGAEIREYVSAGSPALPANRPFLSTEELHGVLGMTPTIVDKLLPLVSVFPSGGEINRSTAPSAVLRADPSIPAEEVNALLARRAALVVSDPFGRGVGDGTTSNLPMHTATQADLAEGEEGPVFTVSVGVSTLQGAKASGRAEIWLTGNDERPFRVLNWYLDRPHPVPPSDMP